MKTLEEVLRKYTLGEAGKDETNDALEELGSSLRLNPGKNELTDEDIRATTVGHYPEQANGYGLLETGTGSLCLLYTSDAADELGFVREV